MGMRGEAPWMPQVPGVACNCCVAVSCGPAPMTPESQSGTPCSRSSASSTAMCELEALALLHGSDSALKRACTACSSAAMAVTISSTRGASPRFWSETRLWWRTAARSGSPLLGALRPSSSTSDGHTATLVTTMLIGTVTIDSPPAMRSSELC